LTRTWSQSAWNHSAMHLRMACLRCQQSEVASVHLYQSGVLHRNRGVTHSNTEEWWRSMGEWVTGTREWVSLKSHWAELLWPPVPALDTCLLQYFIDILLPFGNFHGHLLFSSVIVNLVVSPFLNKRKFYRLIDWMGHRENAALSYLHYIFFYITFTEGVTEK